MISKALKFITDELNRRWDDASTPSMEDFAVLGNIARLDTDANAAQGGMGKKVVVTLVNIEEEKTLKNSPHYVRNGEEVQRRNPSIFINLYILFSCADEDHVEALKKISRTMMFFQRKNAFTPQNAAATFPTEAGVEKIVLDLFTLNFEQVNHLWGIMGGKYLPSILYKARIVAVQDALGERVGVIEEVDLSNERM